jgi:hypothetical protein
MNNGPSRRWIALSRGGDDRAGGFFLWHVGYSTRERDRRLGTRYPVKRGGYE